MNSSVSTIGYDPLLTFRQVNVNKKTNKHHE